MAKTAKKATLEDVWQTIRELGEAQKETDRQIKETELQLKKTMRSIDKTNGNFNNKWGIFFENFVQADLIPLLKQRGIQVTRVKSRIEFHRPDGSVGTEYDLIADNGFETVVVEAKTTFNIKKLHIFMEKLMKFRERFPEYHDKKVYGGIAYMRADGDSAEQAVEQGLFVIKAPKVAAGVSELINPQDFIPKSF